MSKRVYFEAQVRRDDEGRLQLRITTSGDAYPDRWTSAEAELEARDFGPECDEEVARIVKNWRDALAGR